MARTLQPSRDFFRYLQFFVVLLYAFSFLTLLGLNSVIAKTMYQSSSPELGKTDRMRFIMVMTFSFVLLMADKSRPAYEDRLVAANLLSGTFSVRSRPDRLAGYLFAIVLVVGSYSAPVGMTIWKMQWWLKVQGVLVLLGCALWFARPKVHNQDLRDWAVAGLVRYRVRVRDSDGGLCGWVQRQFWHLAYFGPWLLKWGTNCSIFFTLAASPAVPWPARNVAISLDLLTELFNITNQRMQTFYNYLFGLTLSVYFLNAFRLLVQRLVQLPDWLQHSPWLRWLTRASTLASFLLYVPYSLTAALPGAQSLGHPPWH